MKIAICIIQIIEVDDGMQAGVPRISSKVTANTSIPITNVFASDVKCIHTFIQLIDKLKSEIL